MVCYADIETEIEGKSSTVIENEQDSGVRLPAFTPWTYGSMTLVNSQFIPFLSFSCNRNYFVELLGEVKRRVPIKHLRRDWNLVKRSTHIACCCVVATDVDVNLVCMKYYTWDFTLLRACSVKEGTEKLRKHKIRESICSIYVFQRIHNFNKLLFKITALLDSKVIFTLSE